MKRRIIDRKQKKKIVREVFLVLFSLILVFLGFKGFIAFKKSVWQGKDNFNLVISFKENFYLLLFKPQEKNLKVLVIPENVYLEVPPQYGIYPLKNIYSLGEQEFGDGGKLLVLTIEDFIGAPVKGWYQFEDKIEVSQGALLKAVLGNFFLKKGKTNLSLADRLKITVRLLAWRIKSQDWVNLKETSVLTEVARVDGKKILKTNDLLLDDLLVGFFEDRDLRDEGVRVAVFNASEFGELASKMARVLNNLGFKVIKAGNLPCETPPCLREESEILYLKDRFLMGNSLKKIKSYYPLKLRQGGIEGTEAELIFILGQDFWQKRLSF